MAHVFTGSWTTFAARYGQTSTPPPLPAPEGASDFEDIRVFATICSNVIQDKAIISRKIGLGEVRRSDMWLGGDSTTIEDLVDTGTSDSLHRHQFIEDLYNEWAQRWYYKTSLYKPQARPNESLSEAGADLVGFKSTTVQKEVFPLGWNIDNVDEAILVLSWLTKGLQERVFPIIQETMHSSGRMLNLTFVPLPDNHLSGKWKDGDPVKEEQCSWIVSPSFLWGIGGVHLPWVWCNTTFGVGLGGDGNAPESDWTWLDWGNFFVRIINGELLYGRWLVQFILASAADIVSMLFQVLGVYANYHIVGTHWWGTEEEASVVDHKSYMEEGVPVNSWTDIKEQTDGMDWGTFNPLGIEPWHPGWTPYKTPPYPPEE
jgi:hypothetical protein